MPRVALVTVRFSHAITKSAMLDGPDRTEEALYRPEQIQPHRPARADHEIARAALDAVPGAGNLLYARVDPVAADDGSPVVLEVELAEPSLFLSTAPGAAERLSEVITSRL